MNKSKAMKKGARKARKQSIKQLFKNAWKWTKKTAKKVWAWIVKACKNVWNFICRMFRAFWNWLKSIDIIGMINLTLLVAIIVLFVSLISDVVRCNGCDKSAVTATKTETVMNQKQNVVDNRRVVKRRYTTTLPVRVDPQTNIRPQIRTIGVAKPEIVPETTLPAKELPQQVLSGDVIIERHPASPVLSNGVKVNGNLYIQNMRKYTIPCDAKINGHLFIRNVNKVNFCGKFKVNGNVYVNRESSFGPIPEGTKINGQIIL